MKEKMLIIGLCLLLVLTACSKNEPEPPFKPLAEVTADPQHEQAYEAAAAALRGETAVPSDIIPAPVESDDSFPVHEAEEDADSEQFTAPIVPADDPFAEEPEEDKWGFSDPAEPVVYPTEEPVTVSEPVQEQKSDPQGVNSKGQYTYTIQNGESMTCLARRYNMDLTSFLSANGMESDNVTAGTVIILPTQINMWSIYDGSRIICRHPATYTADGGETLFDVACYFGDVFPQDIAKQNGLDLYTVLSAGQQVLVP